ncbi:OprD family outer membrane porin [Solitalea koreensis]|uniref:Outer membrane porin, OprD family n=1 Tax=Solitalea koreensis TaxID=543615 RepID=A0A521D2S6_9SPHI|nr:OprD family outer membrane porin [Solitalea koreensis]SMO65993.1 outer membrane porin, OprD family [Solitalea koreensis]
MKKVFHVTILLIISFKGLAQQTDTSNRSFVSYLNKTAFELQVKTYEMGTINKNNLTDYYASGLESSFSINLKEYKGFSVKASFDSRVNLASSDLEKRDSLANSSSRYEIGLFNVMAPSQKISYGIEELYLQYQHKNTSITWGKMLKQTPFVNPQDGRLRPTLFEGISLRQHLTSKLSIDANWFYKISPRSTDKWFKTEETIGIYSVGVDASGNKSAYANNVKSDGLGIFSIQYGLNRNHHFQVWETWIENINQTVLFQYDGLWSSNDNKGFITGFQYTFQSTLRDGGNENPALSYAAPGSKNNVWSVRIGYKKTNNTATLSFTRISDQGRFLMPREWGHEPFYTFQSRERNEGLANVSALMAQYEFNNPQKKYKVQLSMGSYWLPAVTDFSKNKYGIPSYYQLNFGTDLNLNKYIRGLQIQTLYAYKGRLDHEVTALKYIHNKVDMHHFDLILTYRLSQKKH